MEMYYLSILCSDKPGNHNFDLLKKLVLPDGSVLRAQLPGRPTRDSLFVDPARDGMRCVAFSLFACQSSLILCFKHAPFKILFLNIMFCSLLKVWNVNKCTGVVGVFNCQGAGWCKIEKKTRIHDTTPGTLTASVRASDVDCIAQVAGANWDGETVVYAYKSGN
jgi:raffinose synthase